jgi:hypothetical protein
VLKILDEIGKKENGKEEERKEKKEESLSDEWWRNNLFRVLLEPEERGTKKTKREILQVNKKRRKLVEKYDNSGDKSSNPRG